MWRRSPGWLISRKMKEFEIVCPLTREPRLKEIEAKAG